MPVPRISFHRWLLSQTHRRDPVGDLAREALRLGGTWRSPRGLHKEMLDNALNKDDFEALEVAIREWRALPSRPSVE